MYTLSPRCARKLLVWSWLLWLSAALAAAQTPGPTDPTVPTGAMRSFIEAAKQGDFVEAARHLDLSSVAESHRAIEGPRLARMLKTVLDRKLWIYYEALSDRPEGQVDDGLPPKLDRVGTIDGAEILIERVAVEAGSQIWKVSAGTVRMIPELYSRYGYGRLAEFLPAWMFELSFLTVQLWQWLALALFLAVVWPLSALAVAALFVVLRPIARRTETRIDDELLAALRSPVRLLLAVALFGIGELALGLSVPSSAFLGVVLRATTIGAFTWFCTRLVDILATALCRHLEATDQRSAISVVPMGRRVAKVFLGIIALLVVLANLGVDVTGLIAGLGVGGLAVALAAQKSIANLFGGVSLIADHPVRVGDLCKFGTNQLGTVEEIGLRSTRVRTPDRTLITIPNAEFSEMQLENFAARDRIRLYTIVGLRYETTAEQLRYVLAEIRKLLVTHPKIARTPQRVRFVNFGAHSLDVEIFAYVTTSEIEEFHQVREDLFLRLMALVQDAGTGFAFPSQTLYLGRDHGLDRERARKAEDRVNPANPSA